MTDKERIAELERRVAELERDRDCPQFVLADKDGFYVSAFPVNKNTICHTIEWTGPIQYARR